MALVYPTLIAAMSDAVTPVARAPVVGVYRFWRDSGYVAGALIAVGRSDRAGAGEPGVEREHGVRLGARVGGSS